MIRAMSRLAVVSAAFLASALGAAPATAAPGKSPVDAVLEVQRQALLSGHLDAFAGTFGPHAVAIFPGHDQVATDPAGLRKIVEANWGDRGDGKKAIKAATWKDVKVTAMDAAYGSALSATLAVTFADDDAVESYRVTELLTPAEAGAPTVLAAHFATSVTTDNALAMAPEARPVAIPDGNEDPSSAHAQVLYTPTFAAKSLSHDPAVVVLGTETPEKGVGPVAAAKVLAGWKGINLTLDGKPRSGQVAETGLGYVAGNVTYHSKRGDLPFRVLAIYFEGSRARGFELVSLQYSSPTF
jgi:hypothetical protein